MILSKEKRTGIFVVLLLGSGFSSFIHTAVGTALIPIMQELQITPGTAQWLSSCYSLVMGIMVLTTPFLLRRFPGRALFLTSMGFFCLGLLLAAIAFSFPLLLFGRILQAVGCGLIMSLTQVVVLSIFPPEQRGSMMGLYGLSICSLPALAPTIAGLIIDVASWRMVFGFTLALSLATLVAGMWTMKNFSPTEKLRFDAPSMAMCAFGFTGFVLGLGNWSSYPFASFQVLLPIGAGCLALVIFVNRQNRLKTPFINLTIFSNTHFTTAVVASMLLYGNTVACMTLLPLYLQSLRGFSATLAGIITLPGSLLAAVCSLVSGKLYDQLGIRKLFLAGSLSVAGASLAFSFFSYSTPIPLILILYGFHSAGAGILLTTTVTWGMSTVSGHYTSDGTAILSSLRTIAGAMGSAVFVSLMTTVASTAGSSMLGGLQAAFWGVTLLSMLVLLLAIRKVGVSS